MLVRHVIIAGDKPALSYLPKFAAKDAIYSWATNMNSDQVIAKLRQHAPELRAAGLVHLRVFGSVARGEASAESDIDLLADFDKSRRLTLVTVGRLQSRLTDLLGVNVDLSSEEWMKEPVRKQALREAVLAF
jgi:uncharacterized protein